MGVVSACQPYANPRGRSGPGTLTAGLRKTYRTTRKAARTSLTNASGCSRAAKWPPAPGRGGGKGFHGVSFTGLLIRPVHP